MAATQPARGGGEGGGKGRTAGRARRGGEGSQTHSNFATRLLMGQDIHIYF